jgi:hypothetical protein
MDCSNSKTPNGPLIHVSKHFRRRVRERERGQGRKTDRVRDRGKYIKQDRGKDRVRVECRRRDR